MADTADIADQPSAAVDDISKGCFGMVVIGFIIVSLFVWGLVSVVQAAW